MLSCLRVCLVHNHGLSTPPGTPNLLTSFDCRHHSSGSFMLAQMTHHTSGLATMFTPGNLCLNDPQTGTHPTNIIGLAPWPGFMNDMSIRGNLAVVGFTPNSAWVGDTIFWRNVRLTQHEWSHNFNARDGSFGSIIECTPNQACVTRSTFDVLHDGSHNIWCSNCQTVISANRFRHSN